MRTRDVGAGVVLFVGCSAYYLAASRLPRSMLDTTVTASALPKLLGVAGAALALMLIVQGLLAPRPAAAEGGPGTGPQWWQYRRAAGLLLIGVAYTAVLPYAGYAPSIGLLMLAVLLYYGRKWSLWTLLFAAVGAVVFYLIFVFLLGVRMPVGVWPSIALPI